MRHAGLAIWGSEWCNWRWTESWTYEEATSFEGQCTSKSCGEFSQGCSCSFLVCYLCSLLLTFLPSTLFFSLFILATILYVSLHPSNNFSFLWLWVWLWPRSSLYRNILDLISSSKFFPHSFWHHAQKCILSVTMPTIWIQRRLKWCKQRLE